MVQVIIKKQRKAPEDRKVAHVADYKKEEVQELAKLFSEYPIIGILNMENMPAAQLVRMRQKIRQSAYMRMSKKNLITRAIDQVKDKPGFEGLKNHLGGMPALLFTKENPFKIYKYIAQNKSPAFAKAGQTAPRDLVIPAGPTPFPPGPVIGEFGQLGIKTSVEGGKVTVRQDSVVAKQGVVINDKVASVLMRLGIQPMEVGLDLVAVYENGVIFGKEILAVDEAKYVADLVQGHQWSINLSVEAGYPTKDTIEIMISKAHNEAKNVAVEASIMEAEVVELILAKAEREMLALKDEAKI
ncbi:50S ribosomal protein L10 [Candidatus Woesearchaeota archaeon]|nr:50S ribosomal protein L10 [Candidatus Woesearchaeota archaeon]